MDRFRPNIAIKGVQPIQEYQIDEQGTQDDAVRIGLRKRCKVTTVDQESGTIENPQEPLRTLTAMKTVPGLHGVFFGQNATLLSDEGRMLRVGSNFLADFR